MNFNPFELQILEKQECDDIISSCPECKEVCPTLSKLCHKFYNINAYNESFVKKGHSHRIRLVALLLQRNFLETILK